jgi:hypothetical protein
LGPSLLLAPGSQRSPRPGRREHTRPATHGE